MPRDGSHVYTQPFDDVDPDTTIESAVYNGFTRDIEFDLNQPRPIIAGGTGATSADGALQNLSAEKAAQLVTNFDSHIWMPGSFRHVASATDVGQPVLDHDFAGVCYINEAMTTSSTPLTNENIVVEARDLDDEEIPEGEEDPVPIIPGRVYVREKRDNVWSDWSEPGAGYVLKDGDTMTGPLTLPGDPTEPLHAVTKQYVDARSTFGQCRLTKSGSNLLLYRYNGFHILIDDDFEIIPVGGVTLAPTGLVANTTYYIYVFIEIVDEVETMKLEASTTAYAIGLYGALQKSGDSTRALVGMAKTTASTLWWDTQDNRFVRTWYNDPGVRTFTNLTTTRSTSSTSAFEIHSEIRQTALLWAGETWDVSAHGSVRNNTAGASTNFSIGIDSTTTAEVNGSSGTSTSANNLVGVSARTFREGLSEGSHYATILASVSSGASTGDVYAFTNGVRTALFGVTSR